MGSTLRPILGNVIMAELQKKILQPLIESGKLRFYMRYVDDTLLLAKEDGIKYIFDKFNSFHKNLKFTMNRFEDNNLYFLNIPILGYIANLRIQANTVILTVVYLGITKPCG